LREHGVVGEERVAKLLYLVLTSRFLARPVSLALKASSSAGKSFLVGQVLTFFPPEAAYEITAMSEKALAYGQEPIAHRFVVLVEAAALQSNFTQYLLRSLLSEGRLLYDTVENTPNGLRPRRIEREGPTGLIITTTALRLHPENETRLFSVPVSDTAEQTAAILLGLATGATAGDDGLATGATAGDGRLAEWRKFQSWLAGAEHRVTIPYARRLVELIPPVAVRLRRDVRAVLGLVHSHAILHQQNRSRDDAGRVIATIADYAAVYALVHDLIADAAQRAVPSTIRETVGVVARLLTGGKTLSVSVTDIAAALDLDKATAWRRVQAALARGHLQNEETHRGRPARLLLGDPLPDDQPVLPAPEALAD
jgi:hypothetical protein